MKGKSLILTACFLAAGTGALAQKIKYSQLFVLLSAKQYDQSEPFLKKYLKDNDDNPNAYYHMGLIYQDKSSKADVLKETENVKMFADSAVFFLNLAHMGITEKELKRHDEYYESFSRRDLRTGEFGVVLSDVHLDIEKRMQSLKDRGQRAMTAKSHFVLISQTYQNVSSQYKQIQAEFPSEKEMLLRSDDEIVSELTSIASAYDLMLAEFNSFKSVMGQLGKTGYGQKLEVKEIRNFTADGGGVPDFHADAVEVWDYKKWATDAVKTIKGEVEPLRTKLVAYDIEINKLLDRVKKDSVEVRKEITDLEERLKVNPVARIDAAPMPFQLFQMKIAELNYASDHIATKKMRDSSDLFVRLEALDKDVKNLKKVDSIALKLEKSPLDEEALNYQHFVTNAYGTSLVLKSLVKATREYAEHELARKKVAYDRVSKSKDWIVMERDSVPLTMIRSMKYTHSPLVIQPDRFTTGLKFGADSVANGYFYTITRTRIPDLNVTFPVDKASFQRKNLPVIKGLGSQDEKGQVYFAVVYSETKADDKFPVTIAKIYRTDGLAWSSNYKFEFAPSELIFSADTGELSVKIASPTGESKIVIISKDGKQM
jgi:tetratricopeptide (TPR) repeat protein